MQNGKQSRLAVLRIQMDTSGVRFEMRCCMRNRGKTIVVRFSDEELFALDSKVRKTSLSREAYIRAVLSDTVPVELPPIDYVSLIKELNRIGRNLNQIAAKAHSLGLLNYKEFQAEAEKVDFVVDTMLASLRPQRK